MSIKSNSTHGTGGRPPVVPKPPGNPPALRLRRSLFGVLLVIGTVFAGPHRLAAEDLTRLSLEELMNIKITSVSKKPQRLSESAAAVSISWRWNSSSSVAIAVGCFEDHQHTITVQVRQ